MKTPITISYQIHHAETGERLWLNESKSVSDAIASLGTFERMQERRENEEEFAEEFAEMEEIDEDWRNRQIEIAESLNLSYNV